MLKLPTVEAPEGRFKLPILNICIIAACIALCILSRTNLTAKYSSVESYQHEIEVLDKQKASAAGLSIAAAGASAGISMIPDDICTPIATQLAQISKELAIVTGAILLEKYLLTVFGYAFFSWLLPLCCLLVIATQLMPKNVSFRNPLIVGAIKVLIIGFIAWRAVPISVFVIDMISDTYDITINEAIDNAQQITEAVDAEDEKDESAKQEPSGDEPWYQQWADAASDAIGSAVDTVSEITTERVEQLAAWAQVVLTQITEGFAVLVVTSCVIPILIPLIMGWMVKTFFQPSAMSNQGLPAPRLPAANGKPKDEE